jgi:20S proteasome alpha/beta subunit
MAQTVIGFRCKDFVMFAVTGVVSHYYIKLHDHQDNIIELDSHKLLAASGENADVVHFTEYIKRNMALDRMRYNGRPCTTPAIANYMRTVLAQALRRNPYQTNCLVGGYDQPLSQHDDSEPRASLFYLDYLGTLQEVPFGCHGYGATFVISILDAQWREDLTEQQAIDLMQTCINEVKKRVYISNSYFVTKVVTKEGVQVLSNVN